MELAVLQVPEARRFGGWRGGAVLILPAMLLVGAVLWSVLIRFTHPLWCAFATAMSGHIWVLNRR